MGVNGWASTAARQGSSVDGASLKIGHGNIALLVLPYARPANSVLT
jgi:hypothetical protein